MYPLQFQNLAAEKTYNNLDVSLKTANEHRNEWFEGVQKCTLDETLFEVMERIVRAEVNTTYFCSNVKCKSVHVSIPSHPVDAVSVVLRSLKPCGLIEEVMVEAEAQDTTAAIYV